MALITTSVLPMDTLEALNLCLSYMREAPIDDLALINTSFAAEQAFRKLMLMNRRVQTRGWAWNTSKRTYTPVLTSGQYRIQVESNVVKASADLQVIRGWNSARPMLRGWNDGTGIKQYIVDAKNDTAGPLGSPPSWLDWKSASPITLNITFILEYDALPEAAKAVVGLQAAALCGEQSGEGIEANPFHATDLQQSQADLMAYDLEVDPVNFYTSLDQRR